MIYKTKEFNPVVAISKAKQQGYTITMAAIAADIRHNHTNYDDYTWMLSTDQAEELILEVYTVVTTINKATKPAMVAWAQKKIKSLA